MLTDAELAAIRTSNNIDKQRLVVVGRGRDFRMSWDDMADAVDRTDKLLAEVERLRSINLTYQGFVEAICAAEPHIDAKQPLPGALLDKVKEIQGLRAELEILRLSRMTPGQVRQLPREERDKILSLAADLAAADYAEGGPLREFGS